MVFNPHILDASMRDVVSALTSDQKTDVLLYAMERVSDSFSSSPAYVNAPISHLLSPKPYSRPPHALTPASFGYRSRTTIENATQSVLQASATREDKIIQARLLRAKARFAAGLREAAQQDLQMILQLNSGSSYHPSARTVRLPPRFSNEIWRQIASYLPKRDLRAILRVPHVLSAIARQLLFRRLHLRFGSPAYASLGSDDGDGDGDGDGGEAGWHARRSAGIIGHLASDAIHAGYVRSLVLVVPADADAVDTDDATFQLTMILNLLPKLSNLDTFGCRTDGRATQALLVALAECHPALTSLILDPTSPLPSSLPSFPSLTRFAYGPRTFPPSLTSLLTHRTAALTSLVLHTPRLPPEPRIPFNDLTSLDLHATFQDGSSEQILLDRVLTEGVHLKHLRLTCVLPHTSSALSPSFRAHPTALPSLLAFHFVAAAADDDDDDDDDDETQHPHPDGTDDPDLFPALTDFVRHHPLLRSLRLSDGSRARRRRLGYDAAVWSVLPTLHDLETLAMDVPRDLKPALAGWLVPRTVRALCLHGDAPAMATADEDEGEGEGEGEGSLAPICAGLPQGLAILVFPSLSPAAPPASIAAVLPSTSLLRLGDETYAVDRRALASNGTVAVTRLGREGRSLNATRACALEESDGGMAREFASWVGEDSMPWDW
ncbi:hypothetical protein OF83DRAFT_1176188 [Amylostereum chailletii]|nr:hypothetical protein OF83DRAFT_1176188 [Amylostereum chailletii]